MHKMKHKTSSFKQQASTYNFKELRASSFEHKASKNVNQQEPKTSTTKPKLNQQNSKRQSVKASKSFVKF